MYSRQTINVEKLLLDTSNYRIVKQPSQQDARDAIISEQNRKLYKLAKDIIKNGLSPLDLLMVIPAHDNDNNYIIIEGNRRLTAIQLMLKPDLAKDTSIHDMFKNLHIKHQHQVPLMLDFVVVPDKNSGFIWIERKHASGLEGAGTEPWTSMAKERAEADQGKPTPSLDVVNLVLTNPKLDPQVKITLEGSKFNISTLDRLVSDKNLKNTLSISAKNGYLISTQDKNRVIGLLTEIVTVIATGEYNGKKFTERLIDSEDGRNNFIKDLVSKHPKPKSTTQPWVISHLPNPFTTNSQLRKTTNSTKITPSTAERLNLIPREFKLKLPSGKINDIFKELKDLDIGKYCHAASILFRVFLEFTLDNYLKKKNILMKKDRFLDKFKEIIKHAKNSSLMTDKELKPIQVALADKHSFISPNTLHAYVHSPWMDPDPIVLKKTWNNLEFFIEKLWTP